MSFVEYRIEQTLNASKPVLEDELQAVRDIIKENEDFFH